jgi:hypothetical protein
MHEYACLWLRMPYMLDILILLTAICGDLYTALLNKSLLLTKTIESLMLVRYANKRIKKIVKTT